MLPVNLIYLEGTQSVHTSLLRITFIVLVTMSGGMAAQELRFTSESAQQAVARFEKETSAARSIYVRLLGRALESATKSSDTEEAKKLKLEIERVKGPQERLGEVLGNTQWKTAAAGKHVFEFNPDGTARISWGSDAVWNVVSPQSVLVTSVKGRAGTWRFTFDPEFEFALDVSHANTTAIYKNVTEAK